VTGFIFKFKLELIGKINIKMVEVFFKSKIPKQHLECNQMNYIFAQKYNQL